MALLRFFKLPRHRKYEYNPRYWDQEKEERKERIAQLRNMGGSDTDAMKARIGSGIKRGFARDASVRRSQTRRSNLMLVALVAGLLFISYLVLVIYLPKIEAALQSSGGAN